MTTFEQGQIPPAQPRKASGGVIALGVINIVYSSFFYICCGFASFASPVFTRAFQRIAEQQGIPGYQPSGAIQAYSMINGFVTIVFGVLLLIGGIGLLRLSRWGRTLSMWVAAAVIAWVLVAFVINIFFIYPQFAGIIQEQSSHEQHIIAQVIGGIVIIILEVFFQLTYPVILLICLNLNSIKNQFQGSGSLSY